MPATSSTAGGSSIFRPERSGPRNVLAIVRRDYLLRRSYRFALALDFLYGTIQVLVFYFISRTFSGASADLQGAPTYFDFAFVGIAVTAVLAAAGSGVAERIREEQLTGTLEALVAQPVSSNELAFGLAGFPFLFEVTRIVFYLLLAGVLLGLELSHVSWPGFCIVLVLTGTAFGSLGMLLGGLVVIFKRGTALVGLLIIGMGLLSGAFFPISVLPGWLQPLGKAVPTRFALDGLRSALFKGGDWAGDASALLAFSAMGLPIALWIFARALGHAKRTGSLGQY